MRRALNSLSIEGTVVIGEGERDEAPMLESHRDAPSLEEGSLAIMDEQEDRPS